MSTLIADCLNNIMQEIFKLLMNQISLKKLEFYTQPRQHRRQQRYESLINIPNLSFPGAKDCLKNLTQLYCNSDINPELLYQLSQICHNIQSLGICFVGRRKFTWISISRFNFWSTKFKALVCRISMGL